LNRYDAATKPQMSKQGNAVLHRAKSLAWPASRQTRLRTCCSTLWRWTERIGRTRSQVVSPRSNHADHITKRNRVMDFHGSNMCANRVSLLGLPFKKDFSLLDLPCEKGRCHIGNADLMLVGEAESDRVHRMPQRETKYRKAITERRLATRLERTNRA